MTLRKFSGIESLCPGPRAMQCEAAGTTVDKRPHMINPILEQLWQQILPICKYFLCRRED